MGKKSYDSSCQWHWWQIQDIMPSSWGGNCTMEKIWETRATQDQTEPFLHETLAKEWRAQGEKCLLSTKIAAQNVEWQWRHRYSMATSSWYFKLYFRASQDGTEPPRGRSSHVSQACADRKEISHFIPKSLTLTWAYPRFYYILCRSSLSLLD